MELIIIPSRLYSKLLSDFSFGWIEEREDELDKQVAHAAKLKEMEALLLSEMKRLGDPYRLWDQEAQ